MENKTSPQQALINLAEAASQAKLSFEEHMIVKQSVEVLMSVINPPVKTDEVIKVEEPLNVK